MSEDKLKAVEWSQKLLNSEFIAAAIVSDQIAILSKYGSPVLEERLETLPYFYEKLTFIMEEKNLAAYTPNFLLRLKESCVRFKKELPNFREFYCLRDWYAQWIGDFSSYYGNYKWQPLPNADCTALGNAIACYNLIKTMVATPAPYCPLPPTLFPPIQIACNWKSFAKFGCYWYTKKNGWCNGKTFYLAYPQFYWKGVSRKPIDSHDVEIPF